MAYASARFLTRIEGGFSDEIGAGGAPAGADPDSIGYTRSTGARILCTDTGDIYTYDGANWDQQLNENSTFQDAADALDSVTDEIGAAIAQGDAVVHALYATGVNVNFPGAFNAIDVPRNIKIVCDNLYDGGDITIDGTDIDDNVIQEILTPLGGGGTTLGTKVFKTVTAATQAALGAGGVSASIGTGNKLGLSKAPTAINGVLAVDGINEVGTWDDTADSWGVTPTNIPNGARLYVATYETLGATTVVTATP